MASFMAPAFEFHCIDETEVTVAQYRELLAARGATNTCGQPPECTFNTTYAPAGPDPTDTRTPQVNVDWCDAFMFCRWAGKHLCGTFGYTGGKGGDMPSGNVSPGLVQDNHASVWDAFCVGTVDGAGSAYFYGDQFVSGNCQDSSHAQDMIAPVASASTCHGTGPSTAVYDMIGNASEVRGGSFAESDSAGLSCDTAAAYRRDSTAGHIGLRCCVE